MQFNSTKELASSRPRLYLFTQPRPTKDTALYVTFSALLLTGLFAISNNTVYCSFKAKQLHFKKSKQTK